MSFFYFPFFFFWLTMHQNSFFCCCCRHRDDHHHFTFMQALLLAVLCVMCYFGRKSKRNGSLLFFSGKTGGELGLPASQHEWHYHREGVNRSISRSTTHFRTAGTHTHTYTIQCLLFSSFSFLSASFRSLSYWQLLHINIHWTVLLQCAH